MRLNTNYPTILIVEDDKFKLDSIREFLSQVFLNGSTVEISQSLAGATRKLESKKYDLVIIDMSIHSHDPEKGAGSPVPLPSGGLDVLFEVTELQPTALCIILTQYTDIPIEGDAVPVSQARKEIRDKFGISVAGCVQYAEGESDWKISIKSILELT